MGNKVDVAVPLGAVSTVLHHAGPGLTRPGLLRRQKQEPEEAPTGCSFSAVSVRTVGGQGHHSEQVSWSHSSRLELQSPCLASVRVREADKVHVRVMLTTGAGHFQPSRALGGPVTLPSQQGPGQVSSTRHRG